MYRPSTSSTTSRTGAQDRQALARLSFALSHVLRLYRLASTAAGQASGEISALEEALARAQLPEEYVDVARGVALLKGMPATTGASNGLSPGVHAKLASVLRDMARALGLSRVEEELAALPTPASQESVSPEPLLAIARRLVQSLLVQQSTTEILEDCLENVDAGIQRMVADEAGMGVRLAEMRERLATDGPDDPAILRRALIRETVALERLVAERRVALEDLQRQSRVAQRRAERLLEALADATTAASTDPLTSLGNRRAMAEHVLRLSTTSASTGVLALDVDRFKRINDTFGHGGGDRVLVHLAEILRGELRPDDRAYRVGGEEITVLLAQCEASGTLSTAERIRARIESTPVAIGLHRIQVTVSIGATVWAPGTSFESCQDAADEALYQAKNGGRNRVVAA